MENQRIIALKDRADAIVAAAKAANRDLTAAESRALDSIFDDFAKMREAELSMRWRTASEPVASAAPAPTRFADAPAICSLRISPGTRWGCARRLVLDKPVLQQESQCDDKLLTFGSFLAALNNGWGPRGRKLVTEIPK